MDGTDRWRSTFRRPAMVVGCDSTFAPLALGTALSAAEGCRERNIDLVIYDAGLTDRDRALLTPHVSLIRGDSWRSPVTADLPSYLRTFLHRPLLPRIFPEYDAFLWIDADAWVQDATALDAFLNGAAERELCAALEISHLYHSVLFKPHYRRIETEGYYERCFGQGAALRLGHWPILNSGVFCMRTETAMWEEWATAVSRAWRRTPSTKETLTDQTALNFVAYQDHSRVSWLSAAHNFLVDKGRVVWHAPDRTWRMGDPNRELIKIMHLSGRKDRFAAVRAEVTDGSSEMRSQLFDCGRYLTTTYPERLAGG